MALFKSMVEMAITAGTMFPGTIVPISLALCYLNYRIEKPIAVSRGRPFVDEFNSI
jgi:hypothetical protein